MPPSLEQMAVKKKSLTEMAEQPRAGITEPLLNGETDIQLPFDTNQQEKDDIINTLYFSENYVQDPDDVGIFLDDIIEQTKFNPVKAKPEERGFFGKITESWRRGDATVMADIAVYESAFEGYGNENDALNALRKLQLEQILDPIEGRFLAELVYSGVGIQPGRARGLWSAIPTAFTGMAVGAGIALAAGQVPPLTLAPEEIITVPTGAITGLKAGLMVGSATFWYKQGAGSMYATMREKDYPPELSKHIAGVAAVPYAVVEFLQVSALTPGLRRGALEVGKKSMLRVLGTAAKKYGTTWTTEVFEEVIQEIIQVVAEDTAGFLSGKLKLPEGISKFLMERGRRIWETTKEAGKAMALLPIPGAAIDIRTGAKSIISPEAKAEIEAKLPKPTIPPTEPPAVGLKPTPAAIKPEKPTVVRPESEITAPERGVKPEIERKPLAAKEVIAEKEKVKAPTEAAEAVEEEVPKAKPRIEREKTLEVIPKITKEKFTPQVVQNEIPAKTEQPESDTETQNATNLLEEYWREFDERELEINVAATKNQEATTKALNKKQYLPESDIETSNMSQAMMLYIDLKEHPSGHQFADELSKQQKAIYEQSKNLPVNIRKIADSIIQQNRKAGALAVDKEVIGAARENYIAHLWEKPSQEEIYRARFRQTTARAKGRTLEGGIMEGWAKGKQLRVKDVTLATQIAQSQINQAIVGREMLRLGKKWGLLSHKQPESWVRVDHPGFTTWRHAGKVEVEPKGTIKAGQWVRPTDRKNLGKVESVKDDIATVRFHNKQSGLEQTIDFPKDKLKVVRSYGKNFFVTDEGNLMERVPVYAEPELGKKLNNVFSPSALYKVPGIQTISRYNAQIKSTILFTSLYHHQAYMRSYAFGSKGLNPITAFAAGRQAIMNMTPEVRLLVRNGLTLGRIQDYDPRMIEGEQTIWGRALAKTELTENIRKKLVGLRKQQERFLFNKLGPALKMQAAILELKAELVRNKSELETGDITADEIAAAVARLINNDFGGLHLGRMGRSQTAQHIFRLLALAPDWTESNIKSAVDAFRKGEIGYLHRMFWGRIAVKGLGATILFNLLLSAFDDDDFAERYKKAWETGRLRWLDVDITPIFRALGGADDKRKYFSLLGHFRDPIKFTVRPFVSAKHKGSVVSRIMFDMMIGQDWAGRQFTTLGELTGITENNKFSGRLVRYTRGGAKPISPAQVPSYVLYEVRSAMPIPIQNIVAFLGGEMDAFDAITKSMGLMTSTTYPKKGIAPPALTGR